MKKVASILCSFVISCSAMAGCTYINKAIGSHLPADSFMYHYGKLDSIINANPYDTSKACLYSVQYMEKMTGIKSHADGNYIGWMPFTRKDLIAWKKWYDKRI